MAVWGEKSCLNARWMNEQMNEWSDKWKGCDGLPSDLGGCSQEILTPKWSECMGGDVKGIFRVAVQAPSVCPNHAYLSTSDNVSAPMEVWTRILPYLNAPATRYETFSLTIEMNHGQWAQLRYGTAFFFFFFPSGQLRSVNVTSHVHGGVPSYTILWGAGVCQRLACDFRVWMGVLQKASKWTEPKLALLERPQALGKCRASPFLSKDINDTVASRIASTMSFFLRIACYAQVTARWLAPGGFQEDGISAVQVSERKGAQCEKHATKIGIWLLVPSVPLRQACKLSHHQAGAHPKGSHHLMWAALVGSCPIFFLRLSTKTEAGRKDDGSICEEVDSQGEKKITVFFSPAC